MLLLAKDSSRQFHAVDTCRGHTSHPRYKPPHVPRSLFKQTFVHRVIFSASLQMPEEVLVFLGMMDPHRHLESPVACASVETLGIMSHLFLRLSCSSRDSTLLTHPYAAQCASIGRHAAHMVLPKRLPPSQPPLLPREQHGD